VLRYITLLVYAGTCTGKLYENSVGVADIELVILLSCDSDISGNTPSAKAQYYTHNLMYLWE
jgi:hypothetical protein